ncbi:hypothetical protein TELCIR_03749 [Teladorsagia circumcincta]|uniref:Integrase catalytic domain-containing protein n=1 Tax=Teladorsagia circumcincta TaxID=45464 RepID=A0A2G9UVI4_TELCI|nr:hypothetical protein TELCIR_03749 [Teladorsagia circumcincta]
MLARNYAYWTNINHEIERFVKTRRRYQETAKNPAKTTLCSWPVEHRPWNCIHADFAGTLDGKMYFIVVDAYSKWPKIVEMSSATTGRTIKESRRLFAQVGNPRTLVTDDGPQFTSKDFEDFSSENGRYGNRLYDVLIDGQAWKRPANQLHLNAERFCPPQNQITCKRTKIDATQG